MQKTKRILFALAMVSFVLNGALPVLAQEEPTPPPKLTIASEQREAIVSPEADVDNSVGADILGVSEPSLTPDSGFYFIKEWGRGVENFFTFSDEGKIEKRLEHASERLADIQAVMNDPAQNENITEVLGKQQEDMRVAEEKLAGISSDSESYNQLYASAIDKYSAMTKVLSGSENTLLETNKDIVQEIYNAKNMTVASLAKAIPNLDGSNMQLEEILSSQTGSEFKDFRDMELLSMLADKVPAESADAVLNAQKNISENLVEKFTLGASDRRGEDFANYIMTLKGSEADQMAVLDQLAKSPEMPDDVVNGFREAKDVVAEKFATKMINHPASEEMMNEIANGDIDKLIVLEEMANALPESNEVKATLESARQKGLDLATQKMGAIESVDDKINFLLKDGVPNAKSFVMLEQIQSKLPASQRGQMVEVRNKAFQIFSNVVDNAENSDKLLERMAGDSPSDVELIATIKNNLPAGLAFKFDILAKKQLDKIETRLADETDLSRLMEMRSALDESPQAQEMMKNLSPEMISNINKTQTDKIAQILDQAGNAEDVIKLSNQYNDMLAKFPNVADNIKINNPELINSIANKQIEKIQIQLNSVSDPALAREMMRNFDLAGLAKLKGSLPPGMEKAISSQMTAHVKNIEKQSFMAEMKSQLGENYDEEEAQKMFESSIGAEFDTANGMPDEATISAMKEKFQKETGQKMMDSQKEALIRKQVEEEMSKNAGSDAPSAGDVVNQIMKDADLGNMTEAPSQDKINEIKARMGAEARAKAEADARVGAGSQGSAPSQTPSAPSGASSEIPSGSIPQIDCSQFSAVPSCDYVPANVQDACRKCKILICAPLRSLELLGVKINANNANR